jgi:hypothetical protein
MASPFSIFRKRQKLMMILLCLMAMFAFGLFGIISNSDLGRVLFGQSGGQNAVVVKTVKYGNLRQSDVAQLRNNKVKLLRVWMGIANALGAQSAVVERWLGDDSEETVINDWLKARRAHELGIVADEKSVNELLGRQTGNRIPVTEIQKKIRDQGLREEQFFALMEEKLLADQFADMSQTGLRAMTPSQRWDYFNRLNQLATIEAVAVPAANFTKEIKDPTDEELKTFFDKHKDAFSNPDSPEPGFHKRQKVSIEYVKADVDEFAKKNVTDKEVDARFEKDKKQYDQWLNPASEEKAEKPAEKDANKSADKDVKETKPAATMIDNAKKTDAVKKPAELKDEKKATKDEPKKEDAKKDVKKTTSLGHASAFLPTALLQAEPAAAKPAASKKETPKADVSKAETPKKDAPKQEAKTAKPAAAAKEVKDVKPAEKAASEKKAADEAKAETLKIIKNHIRQQIAREKIEEIFAQLHEPMERYQAYEIQKLQNAGASVTPATPRPNFEEFAKKHGFAARSIGPLSASDMQTSGDKAVRDFAFSRVGREYAVMQYAYRSPTTFRAETSQSVDGEYLFWKTNDFKEHVPKFSDPGVRDATMQAWKMIQARELAWKAAEKLAEKAKNLKSPPLKQTFADRPDLEVRRPPSFTWLTYGNIASASPNAVVSEVPGVQLPGNDFMRTVFRLEPGQIGVAFNAPKTIAYVVRPSEFSPSYDERWRKFQVESVQAYVAASAEDMANLQKAWLKELQTSAGFEWTADRKPEQENVREQPDFDE